MSEKIFTLEEADGLLPELWWHEISDGYAGRQLLESLKGHKKNKQ